MNLEEFKRQVIAGEITDFEPYFESDLQEYRYILAKHGFEVDRVIQMDGPKTILKFIKDKVHVNNYEKWKNHQNVNIRQELARAGYFENDYYDDPDENVRTIVAQNNIRKNLTRIRSDIDLTIIKYQLESIVNIDTDILIAYTNKQKQWANKYKYDYNKKIENRAFQLKLDMATYTPTTIEKTMNEAQLFDANCPLWTKLYTPHQIYKILFAEKHVRNRGYKNFTQALFDAFHEKERTFHPEDLTSFTIKLLKKRS